jgi:hypothetical protein
MQVCCRYLTLLGITQVHCLRIYQIAANQIFRHGMWHEAQDDAESFPIACCSEPSGFLSVTRHESNLYPLNSIAISSCNALCWQDIELHMSILDQECIHIRGCNCIRNERQIMLARCLAARPCVAEMDKPHASAYNLRLECVCSARLRFASRRSVRWPRHTVDNSNGFVTVPR